MAKKKKSTDKSGVKGMAADTWEKLEQVFESRVARVLNAMQIPTHDDVQDLAQRVEALTRAVEKLGGEPVQAPVKPKRKSATRGRAKTKAGKASRGKTKRSSKTKRASKTRSSRRKKTG